MFPISCFQLYFQPIYIYIKRAFSLAMENDYALSLTAILFTASIESLKEFLDTDVFGVTNLLLFLVLGTVFIDAFFGIKKSLKQSKEAYIKAQTLPENAPERKKLLKEHELKKFSSTKLQFTFFKCFTLLGYLFFAKTLLEAQDPSTTLETVLGFTTVVLIKTPVAIFWYYDFKSIGENAAYLHGKKARIFIIAERIFELRINKFFNSDKNGNPN